VVRQSSRPSFGPAVVLLAATALFPRAVRGAEPPATPEAVVHVHERAVFTLKADRAAETARERAASATHALEGVVDRGDPPEGHLEERDGVAVVFIGKTPIVTLGEEDAVATGEVLHAYAASIAASAEDGVRAEEKRSSIANTVFSVSLLVFSGLLAFLLSRRVDQFADRARAWLRLNPHRVPALRLRHIEVIRPHAVRGAAKIGLGLAPLLAQISIGYGWLLVALSLFAATRGYTERLTGFVLAPLWAVIGRLGSGLPVLVVASVAALAVGVLVRFIALFFESVGEGSTTLGWLSADLAPPTSVLARAGVILASLVLAAPLLTGTDDGALSRVGVAVLVAIGLSATPILACVAAGLPVVFGRSLVPGDFIEIGEHQGRVTKVSLLAVTLDAADGAELRIPHLLTLVRATRVIGATPPVSFDITIGANEAQARVRERLLAIVAPLATRATVELCSLDADGAHYRLTACRLPEASDLAATLADSLRAENVTLGRVRPNGSNGTSNAS
jgi:small-conductance mechanosensitive channel